MADLTPRQKLLRMEKIARAAAVDGLELQSALEIAREKASAAQAALRAVEREATRQAMFVHEVEEQVRAHKARHTL